MRTLLTTVAIALVTASTACKSPAPAPAKEASPAPKTTTLSATVTWAKPAASAKPPRKKGAYTYKDQVTLTGRIEMRQVITVRQDAIMTPFLILDAPISVYGDNYDHDDERELWYAGNSDAKSMVGKRVTYKGGLEPMMTGHHHSNVWLTGTLEML